jgi:glyoxylate reductase
VDRVESPEGCLSERAGCNEQAAVEREQIPLHVLHCPLNAQTCHLIDGAALEWMRSSAVLVNTARGPIVDERALIGALRGGMIAGAALDVYEHEPDVSEELLSLENVVLTPHLGSATRETREAMGLLAVAALRALLVDGRTPPNLVRER